MKFAFTVMFVAATPGHAFTSSKGIAHTARNADTALFLEPNALTEYMAKAHEEKLKAVKAVEEKAEIMIRFFGIPALTEYRAKAHAEELKAVKVAEEKKEAEIQVRFYTMIPGDFQYGWQLSL
jgi:alkanesulfonate monooxygenase SsuD/methylene tetrahydromethanopterin reductase-like flavin-dependent oxidoreductase (luciferase family)